MHWILHVVERTFENSFKFVWWREWGYMYGNALFTVGPILY